MLNNDFDFTRKFLILVCLKKILSSSFLRFKFKKLQYIFKSHPKKIPLVTLNPISRAAKCNFSSISCTSGKKRIKLYIGFFEGAESKNGGNQNVTPMVPAKNLKFQNGRRIERFGSYFSCTCLN